MIMNRRIWHETYECWWKRERAERAIYNCAAVPVEGKEGESIRKPTIEEAIAARNEQARLREPLAYAEVHGLRFEPPVSGVAATRREGLLLWQAHEYAMSAF